MRRAKVKRRTKETSIEVELNLDGKGVFEGGVPCGFFQHMLESLAKHAGFDVRIDATGDIHVDMHHLIEDTGIVLGMALSDALGERAGIVRFGDALVPMDEALVQAAVDISGRGAFYLHGEIPGSLVGDMPVEMVEEFWIAFCREARLTLHVRVLSGRNSHHSIEALFKAVARALRKAVSVGGTEIPSTKGVL